MIKFLHKGLIKGSFVLLVAFGLFNFFHFLFQFIMARMLGVSDYGILATLFAIIYILLIFSESVQTIIAKYSAQEKDNGKLKNIFRKSFKKSVKASIIVLLAYLIIAIPLSSMLKIKYWLVSLNGLVIFLAFFLPISRGIMQGRRRFTSLGLNMVVEALAKVALGVFLVYIGFSVYGAIIGVLIAGVLAFLFSFIQLKDIIEAKEKKAGTVGIYEYAKPTFLITFIIVVFYSLDVIIAKIIFAPEIAGSYAIASILGKIIFWGTLPISKAMFPISAESFMDKNKAKNVFINALAIVFIGIAAILTFFYFFPGKIISAFSGKQIPEAASILFYSGIAFSITSLTNLILLYKLSLGKTKRFAWLFTFVILEALLLWVFSADLLKFSIAFVAAAVAFLWGSVVLIKD